MATQRDAFLDALFPIFQEDRSCVFVTADDGAPALDQYWQQIPERFVQVGIAEQQMIGLAAGLAVEGKRPYTFCIAPFASARVYEFLKLDVAATKLPVTILGVGAGYSYDAMGPSHHCVEDLALVRTLPGVSIWSPADAPTAAALARHLYEKREPCYVRFERSVTADLYTADSVPLDAGMAVHQGERDSYADVVLISTGIMVHQAIEIAKALRARGVAAEVVDLFRPKPLNVELPDSVINSSDVVTLEEHFLAGGIGSIVAEHMLDAGYYEDRKLLRLGRTETAGYCFNYGGREEIWRECGLDVPTVVERVIKWE